MVLVYVGNVVGKKVTPQLFNKHRGVILRSASDEGSQKSDGEILHPSDAFGAQDDARILIC